MRTFFLPIVFVVIIGCKQNREQFSEPKTGRASANEVEIVSEKNVILDTKDDLLSPAEVISVMFDQEKIYLLDGFRAQQAFIYNSDGLLEKLLGKPGQGPGEYKYPGGFCKNEDRIHIISGGKRYLIYDGQGNFIKNVPERHPGGIGNKIHKGKNGTFYMTVYSRFATDASIHHIDPEGNLINKFSPPDEDYVTLWDLYAPMGDICVLDEKIAQVFNHKYEVKFFDLNGKHIETRSLHSNIYRVPDYENLSGKEITGRAALKQLKEQSLVNGIFTFGDGFVTALRFTSLELEAIYLEFWDSEFNGTGRMKLPEGETLVATKGKELVLFNPDLGRLKFLEI